MDLFGGLAAIAAETVAHRRRRNPPVLGRGQVKPRPRLGNLSYTALNVFDAVDVSAAL
jgi:hypothetical protein